MKLIALFATLAVVSFAAPAHAQFVTIRDASIGFAEGNQAGNVVLTLSGTGEAVAQGLTLDLDSGRYEGSGRIDYDGGAVHVHVADAQFSVRLEAFEPPASCVTPVGSPAFAAHIEVRDGDGNLVCVAGSPVIDNSLPCPRWTLMANIGSKLPASLPLLRARYRDARVSVGSTDAESSTWGKLKKLYRA